MVVFRKIPDSIRIRFGSDGSDRIESDIFDPSDQIRILYSDPNSDSDLKKFDPIRRIESGSNPDRIESPLGPKFIFILINTTKSQKHRTYLNTFLNLLTFLLSFESFEHIK